MDKADSGLDIATFLGASIHDMKNSVSVMQALLENSLTEVLIHAPHAVSHLDQALYETRRVSDNLVQLLALYKIAGDLYPFDPQEHEVGDFLIEAVARVESLAQFRNLSLSQACEPGLSWYFDWELVLVAIVQALHNGLRYTRSHVRLSAAVRDGMLEFRVEDDGKGYPQSMLVQEQPTSQSIRLATGSTGLGLYFSVAVAQLHKNRERSGRTHLENGGSLGGGAFILALP